MSRARAPGTGQLLPPAQQPGCLRPGSQRAALLWHCRAGPASFQWPGVPSEWEMFDQHLGSDQMEFSTCDGSDVSTRPGRRDAGAHIPTTGPSAGHQPPAALLKHACSEDSARTRARGDGGHWVHPPLLALWLPSLGPDHAVLPEALQPRRGEYPLRWPRLSPAAGGAQARPGRGGPRVPPIC